MSRKIISPIESIYNIIQYWIEKEMNNDGTLNDVSLFIPSSGRFDQIDAPLIWLEKQEITSTTISHSNMMSLRVPVSIICCDEIIDTIIEAEESSCNIACRCITAILLNMIEPRPMGNHIHLRDFRLERFYPNITPTGAFEIQNKTAMMAATRVDVVFVFDVDWTLYEQMVAPDTYHPVEYGDFDDVDTGIQYDITVLNNDNAVDEGIDDDESSPLVDPQVDIVGQ